MNRITKKQLQTKVNYINHILNRPDSYMDENRNPCKGHIFIDKHNPGDKTKIYKLAELGDNFSESDWTNYRMTIREFYIYLTGIIDGLERERMS